MENQSAVAVRFYKNRKLAFWRVFGEIDALRLKQLCKQMTMFNYHHQIRFCVFDFSKANVQLSRSILTEKMKTTTLKSAETSLQQFHIVFPDQNNHGSCINSKMTIDPVKHHFSAIC